MFSLFICIIVNIVSILFYLQVEPVFLPACLNKAIQITSVSSISATMIIFANNIKGTKIQSQVLFLREKSVLYAKITVIKKIVPNSVLNII